MEVIAIASAAVSAFGQYKAGQAAQAQYKSQAAWNAIQAENDAIQYEQQGVNALRRTLRTVSAINARAAAGNINPWSGSTGNLQDQVLHEGYTDFNISKSNAMTRRMTGQFQSNIYNAAGKSAYQQGVFGALSTVGTAAVKYGQIGGPPGTPTTPPTPGATYTLPSGPLYGGNMGFK